MSAAATALKKTARPYVPVGVPAAIDEVERKKTCPPLRSDKNPAGAVWTATINAYYDVLPRKLPLGGIEYLLVGLIVRGTYGAAERPLWCAMPAQKTAARIIASKEAVEQGLRALVAKRVIAVRSSGKQNVYSLAIENWDELPDRELRESEKKPQAVAEDPHLADLADADEVEANSPYKVPPPVLLSPGERSKFYKLSNGREWRGRNLLPWPAAILVSDDPEGPLEIVLQNPESRVKTGDDKAKSGGVSRVKNGSATQADRRTVLRQSTQTVIDTKGLSEIGSQLTHGLESPPPGINRPVENARFEAFLALVVEIGLPTTRAYIQDARELWQKLPLEEQLGAVRMLAEHQRAGTFEHENLRYWRIDWVVKKCMWELPVKNRTKKERADEDFEAKMKRGLAWCDDVKASLKRGGNR